MTQKTTTSNRSQRHHSEKARDPCNPRNGDMHSLSVIEYYSLFIQSNRIFYTFIFNGRRKRHHRLASSIHSRHRPNLRADSYSFRDMLLGNV